VIVKARNTLIPVNCPAGAEFPIRTEYNRFEMETHLKKCEGRRNDWQQVVKTYLAFPEMRYSEVDANLPSEKPKDLISGDLKKKEYNPVIKDQQAYNASKSEFQKEIEKEQD